MEDKAKVDLALRIAEEVRLGCGEDNQGGELQVLDIAVCLLLGPSWRIHNAGL